MNIIISYNQLKSILSEASKQGIATEGYVVFRPIRFAFETTSENERTYAISSLSPAFVGTGSDIIGEPVDGSEPAAPMNDWIQEESNGASGWQIEKCYVSDIMFERFSYLFSEDNAVSS